MQAPSQPFTIRLGNFVRFGADIGCIESACTDWAFLQAALGRVKLDSAGKSFNLRMETNGVIDSLKRITQAFSQYCAAPDVRSTLLPVALVTARVVRSLLWENAEGSHRLLQMVRFERICEGARVLLS